MAWGFSFQYLTARAWSVVSALMIMLALVLSPFDVAQAHDMAHPVVTETAQTQGPDFVSCHSQLSSTSFVAQQDTGGLTSLAARHLVFCEAGAPKSHLPHSPV